MSNAKNDEVVLTPSKAQILPSSDTTSTHSSSSAGFETLNVEAPEKNQQVEDTIFGNEISKPHPPHLGKMITLLYIRGQPIITIGPDCKIIFIYNYRRVYIISHLYYSRCVFT